MGDSILNGVGGGYALLAWRGPARDRTPALQEHMGAEHLGMQERTRQHHSQLYPGAAHACTTHHMATLLPAKTKQGLVTHASLWRYGLAERDTPCMLL